MKAVIVDTFNNYDLRTIFVYNRLKDLGYETTVLSSDFSHSQKQKISRSRDNTVFIDTKPYVKNMSLKRISSHLDFAQKVYEKIREIKPEVIYCLVPLNSLVAKIKKYALKNDVKVFFDIFDLWPESLPTANIIKKILYPWKRLRDKNLSCSDAVFLECSYYERFLPNKCKYKTAYLCKAKREVEYVHEGATLNFLYLGAINSIIDIENIVSLLSAIQQKRKVHLSIIGNGETKDYFKSQLQDARIEFTDHGVIYDDEKKDEIISKCHFGINMYKAGLCIGLTMKSLEYFCRALPIVSANIYDTKRIIEGNDCGFDVTDKKEHTIRALQDLSESDWFKLHKNCEMAHGEYFTEESFSTLLESVIK